ncbi:hypothetical protein HS9_03914 [Bacillus velezensis]|nr:hypothetical protein HS9_03914 [Bacillus velezensis]
MNVSIKKEKQNFKMLILLNLSLPHKHTSKALLFLSNSFTILHF